ncbi:MAG: 2-C-methyl-D-erythritol 4-phosphate cytidylyltransferase [Actinomycetota bacterium]|nr:2-C-methyl-D-erythritol 4-phosphate cytidylyltransferase [Actinomycetota bacterium]
MAAAGSIERVIIAAPPGGEDEAGEIAVARGVEAVVVPGGDHRSESVANALAQVGSELLVVHDAARPLVPPALIDEVVTRLAANDDVAGVIAAIPATDTIKEASVSRRVVRTPERSRMWVVQTPQAFRASSLREAFAEHADDLATASDDAVLVERSGGEILLQEASAQNIKVTTPLDLEVAELLLAGRSPTELF